MPTNTAHPPANVPADRLNALPSSATAPTPSEHPMNTPKSERPAYEPGVSMTSVDQYAPALSRRDDAGNVFWALPDGRLHRSDGPAVEWADGGLEYRQHGLLHRSDGPAMITAHGLRAWYSSGLLHRLDGPAHVDPDGTVEYWVYGSRIDVPRPTPTSEVNRTRGRHRHHRNAKAA